MEFTFKEITYEDVLIMEGWRYNGFEKQLYMDSYHESQKRGDSPLIGPGGCRGFSAYSDFGLSGLFEFYKEKSRTYIGLALHPELVGRNWSGDFIKTGLTFGRSFSLLNKRVYLAVDRRNIQGIRAYEKTGFIKERILGDEIHYYIDINW